MKEHNLTPTHFCERQQERFIAISDLEERKQKGQFFTPLQVACFMARLALVRTKAICVLDPGAGTGILACAVAECEAQAKKVQKIHIDAYENDSRLVALLSESLEYTGQWLASRDIELTYNVLSQDFVLANAKTFWSKESTTYDLAIGNPPYFKIGKNDERARLNQEWVYGQPNIYALFMGVAAELLKNKGVLVFITPRSYTAGPYFQAFRRRFFNLMRPERVHLFESRTDTFRADEVLQENIILKACKGGFANTIDISKSHGVSDIFKAKTYKVPLSLSLFKNKNDLIFRLPVSEEEKKVLETVDQWPGSLHKYGLQISTGPVVPFRAKELISTGGGKNEEIVPLLWMQHVRPMEIRWPLKGTNNNKEKWQYIKDNTEARRRKLLVATTNLILLRRFSAKEAVRRLVAAPLLEGQLSCEFIGIENHLNYIYGLQKSLSQIQTLGLSALLNSSLLDKYFRISNGNTQVSATELKSMPLPPLSVLSELGDRLKGRRGIPELEELDVLIESLLGTLD